MNMGNQMGFDASAAYKQVKTFAYKCMYVCMYVCMCIFIYIAVVISDNVQLTQSERCMYCMYAECNNMYLLISVMCDDVRFRKGNGCR